MSSIKATVILVCYNRFERFDEVLQAWFDQVDEVIVLDNSGKFKTDLDVLVVSMSKNYGPVMKYSMSFWARNEWIIYADDDILPLPGLAKDLWELKAIGDAVSMIGRVFDGKSYYTSTGYRGRNAPHIIKADWVGCGCAIVHRSHGAVNVRNCPVDKKGICVLDDWWFTRENALELYIIPTDNYRFLQQGVFSKRAEVRRLREEWYDKHYRNKNKKS